MATDPHSFSNPEEARVTHLHWNAIVDFHTKTIEANADWEIEIQSETGILVLDTKGMIVNKVTLPDGQPAEFRLGPPDPLLGQALRIVIPPGTRHVRIDYKTKPDAAALQWLSPKQTHGKEHPFLFSQSQAILARSWIPCQDSPAIRFTYSAQVSVPVELLALMSATNPEVRNDTGTYLFEMDQPIPSYLLALAVGDIDFQPISERSGIYAEPSVLKRATWEFADLEKMVSVAESLYGEYRWGRYDVLVLPPSFPFGGMENPRLTFATPTILTGDRSLTALIAHELAHSWSGNLVTNATWNDFWLNEGFTVYFEHRILEKLYGEDYAEMSAALALQDLHETIATLQNENKIEDTSLKLNLGGRNPDEGVTDIAYNKGYFFLRTLDEEYGRDYFDSFLTDYFKVNSFGAMDTETFISGIKKFYQTRFDISLDDEQFTNWIYRTGLPASCPQPVSKKLTDVNAFLEAWLRNEQPDESMACKWSTQEWLHFLKNLPGELSQIQLEALDRLGNFTSSGNAEITVLWLIRTIRHHYPVAEAKLKEFLMGTGRRKFLTPLYEELITTPTGRRKATQIYESAREGYHYVATNTLDALLE